MSWRDELIGDANRLPAVVLATVVTCLVLLVLVRAFGARAMAPSTVVDFACLVAVGAVVGRTTLLSAPTLAGGVLALTILFVLHRGLGAAAQWPRLQGVVVRPPVVLMSNGVVDERALLRVRVSENELRQRLRLAGIASRDQVTLAVWESHGRISVLRDAAPDAWVLGDLRTNSAT